MKYCLRKRDVRPGADMIWELDDELNYVDALYGFKQHDRRVPVYKLYKRSDLGVLQRVGTVTALDVRVPIRDVKCKYESQENAIQTDLSRGDLEGLY